MNHFYDPVNDRALTLSVAQASAFSLATGESTDFHAAPNWATGTQDAFAQSPVPEDGHRNHFTVFDAREAEYRGLTGTNKAGQDVASTKVERDKYWATLFRALGDIVHLVQDMAQPQHTRNDMHSGIPGYGHKSVYEIYLDCRATEATTEEIDRDLQANGIRNCDPLNYGSYATPVFTQYSDYFATRDGQGRGLAEYSNRNFFTAGTNLGNNNYPSPANNRSQYTEESAAGLVPASLRSTVKFLRGDVSDTQAGATDNIRLTTESAFDYFIGATKRYSLNKYIYDDQARLLIPRSVAYSAGLIDYFFRGRLAAEETTFVDEAVSLKVKNAIDVKKFPDYAGEKMYNGGKLIVTREYKIGDEKRLDASDAVLLEEDIEPGMVSERSYNFIFQTTLPQGIASIKFRLVFRGKLGQEEDAVAVGSIRPHSGFVVTPDYAPADGLMGSRHIYRYANRWMLSDETGLVAGNIDWKGWYDPTTGKPTKTLSWNGPQARYFPDWGAPQTGDGPFSPEIFQNGELYAVAPYPVLGAAIRKDQNGAEWLIVICKDGAADTVYQRHNKKNDSPALYDPVTNPEGWQLFGRYTHDELDLLPGERWEADRPWFFNGTGTEARAMRQGYKMIGSRIYRSLFQLKFTTESAGAMVNEDNTSIQAPWSESKTCTHESSSDPNSVCVGQCGGVMHGSGSTKETYTNSGLSSGEMIATVDYNATGPVYAKYSVRYNGNKTFSEETSGQHSTVCGADGYGGVNFCSSPSNYNLNVFTRIMEDSPGYSEVITMSGPLEVKLWSRTGMRRSVYSNRTEDTGGNVTYSQSLEVFSDLVTTYSFIQYMDLRNGIMSVFTQTVSEQGLGTADPFSSQFGELLPVLMSVRSEQKLYSPGGTIVLHENPQGNVNVLVDQLPAFPRTSYDLLGWYPSDVKTDGNISYIKIYDLDSKPWRDMACNSEQSYDVVVTQMDVYSLLGGSWAVDNSDNMLTAAMARSYSPRRNTTNYFSYISGGNLGQLIPLAPENSRYSGIGVIH